MIAFTIVGCSEDISTARQSSLPTDWVAPQSNADRNITQRNFTLQSAQWQSDSNTLLVEGTANNIGERIQIINPVTEKIIATTLNDQAGWKTEIIISNNIPCQLRIVSESGTLKNATISPQPINCVSFDNTSVNTLLDNDVSATPEAIITSPATDLTINLDDAVVFSADARNTVGNERYSWVFSGAAPSSTVQNPGLITFSEPGVFHVAVELTDSRGLSDPTPPMRMITVIDPNAVLTGPPVANIDTPVGDQTIPLGGVLNFTGSGTDPGGDILTYLWDFTGATPNSSTQQNPGDVTFDVVGESVVTLTVTDTMGNTAMSQLTVTVLDPSANQAPAGMITNPLDNVTITAGDALMFESQGSDPDGNEPLSYEWAFSGVIPNSTMQNPGLVTFQEPGSFEIQLTVTDSLGLSDPNPPIIVVTVLAADAPVVSDLPNGEILTPLMDTTITAGESVMFTAMGTAAPGNEPLSFLWNFGSAAAESVEQNPGAIMFEIPGSYTVTLTVSDAAGQTDPQPAVRIITVEEAGGGAPTLPGMVNHIDAPVAAEVTIAAGDAVMFSGSVSPEINGPYTYLWLFDGAAPNNSMMVPGEIVFDNPGVFDVMFFAIDVDGLFDPRPARRTISVEESQVPPPATPQGDAPLAAIITPASDIEIMVGESVTFGGTAVDTAGNNTISYLWTFDGAAPNADIVAPDPVTFDNPGEFLVTFTATDTTTMLTSAPATVLITVLAPPGGGAVDQPVSNGIEGIILEPAGDMTINVNSVLNFEATGTNSVDAEPLNYVWDFGNGTEVVGQTPGNVTFNMVGTFEVTLTVDNGTVSDLTPASVVITVVDAGQP